jgi:hypothetical protein
MSQENFNSTEQSALEKKTSMMIAEWKDTVEDAGLTDEYKRLFLDSFEAMPKEFTQKNYADGEAVPGIYRSIRYALIDTIQGSLREALLAIARNAKTGEKIDVNKDQLDAANLYNLLIEDSHSKEREFFEN